MVSIEETGRTLASQKLFEIALRMVPAGYSSVIDLEPIYPADYPRTNPTKHEPDLCRMHTAKHGDYLRIAVIRIESEI